MNSSYKLIASAFVNAIGRERAKRLISAIAHYGGIDLLHLAYNNIGILKYENDRVSGEHFLVTKVLKKNLATVKQPVIFDVGANIGSYSRVLAKEIPQAQIYAFEPNNNSFHQLVENTGSPITCINAGMGTEEKMEKIHTYADNLSSSHASLYEGVFSGLHNRDDLAVLDIQLTTLDLFCERESVPEINFLKIDTEGNELNVIKGGQRMIREGKIHLIQFEFGECDVFSRVFLQDFYNELSDYNIYRLDSQRLIPLFKYASTNEIFRFQNFLAVRKDFPFQGFSEPRS